MPNNEMKPRKTPAERTRRFKTKSMFKQRDNGDIGDKWLVALDIGYSAVKIFSPNVCAMFPSYAKKEEANFIGEIDPHIILYKDLDTGETWTVGEDAMDRIDVRETNDSEAVLYGRERYNSPMFRVLVETGIGMGCISSSYHYRGNREVYVQTGLPPKYLATDAPSLSNVIKGRHHFSLQLGNNTPVEFNLFIKPDNIDVMSQPMGTLFSVMIDNNHEFVDGADDYFRKAVLVFDPGFGTLDIFPVIRKRVGKSETNDHLGMKRVIAETVKEINEKHNQNIPLPAMQKYLGTGTFRKVTKLSDGRTATEDIPFDDILASKNGLICNEAIGWLKSVVSDLSDYDYLVITGGTSAAWCEFLRKEFAHMTTLTIVNGNKNDDLPFTFANVRGYFMYRYAEFENSADES